MSKVQVDKVVNLSDDGAPQLTYGAELPVGYGLTGAGGLNITGVVTAASAVFSGNVTIGGTLTYEDVTNIDSVGIITAKSGINITGGEVKVGAAFSVSQAGVVTATSYYGDGSNLSNITSTTINNNADNRLITGSGTANTLNGESSITYDGTKILDITSSAGGFFRGTDTDGGVGLVEMGNGNVAIQADTGNAVADSLIHWYVDNTERMRLDSSGRLLIGATATQSVGGGSALAQIQSVSSTGRLTVTQHRNEAGGSPYIVLGKSRGTSLGAVTILQDDDDIGTLAWAGADGSDMDNQAAAITAQVDGTPGSDDMPGRLIFKTTADGAGSASERLRITAAGRVGIAEDDPDTTLHVKVTSTEGIRLERNGGTVAEWVNDTDLTTFGTTSNHNVAFKTNATERIRVTNGGLDPTTDAATDLGNSSKRWRDLYLSSGVFLGGTGSANELTDYEEGTWTPVPSRYSSPQGAISCSMSTQTGRYRKIGKLVQVEFYISISSVTSQGGSATYIAGLPFAPVSAYMGTGNLFYNDGLQHDDSSDATFFIAPHTELSGVLYFRNELQADSGLSSKNWQAGHVTGSVTYQTTS